ncbi:MAG TPA: phage holin family protein [Candidatus Ozemobacteraceae bacterium]|nr:phage holin family protein [Candidatus Ozemobacteraceae bacterium]HQG30069.1 phage holin family protein [Candidatus Ozemobacteraceae bacterium]
MISTAVSLFLGSVAVLALPRLVPGIKIRDYGSALRLVIAMALIGTFVNLVLGFFTLGLWRVFQALSLGALSLLVNTFALDFASDIVGGVEVDSFSSAFRGGLVVTIWTYFLWILIPA